MAKRNRHLIVCTVLASILVMLVPAPVLAAEDYLSGLCEEDVFVDYPSASDEDSLSDVMALGYDGEQVTSSIVESIYEKFITRAAQNSSSMTLW